MNETHLAEGSDHRPADRLHSWKEIAAYLKRDVSTVQRWEKRERMPVHRHLHDKLGSVYAFRSELDAWWESRRVHLKQEQDGRTEAHAPFARERSERGEKRGADARVGLDRRFGQGRARWLIPAGLVVFTAVIIAYVLFRPREAAYLPITSLAVLPLENLSTRMASVAIVNPAAHEEYQLGRYFLWKYINEDQKRAIDHFERAVRIEPGYAAAHAGLAHAWWVRGVFGPLSLKEVESPARAAALKALELDDRLAEAHVAKAYLEGVFDWNWGVAETTIRRALELDPNSLDAHYVWAVLLMALGRHSEAIAQIETAAQLDPLSAQVHSTFGRILYRARKYDEAIVHLNRAIELEPRNAGAYSRLGNVYSEMGRYVEAIAALKRGGDRVNLARVYARMGSAREARIMLPDLGDRSAPVYAALGDKDAAFRLLFKSIEERRDWPIFIKADPPFDSLHSDPRWTVLLRRMNLPIG